ncbi:lytic transglycosylase domain-containing protein [Erythrobacter aureus]|uniref:Lytic transglycosylase domain-containing protein n=1 Tax=Erythrobacter aureus TaxID=2182384 RepID=A0A345YB19_9SPHN|nr:lytic transglycosylase domain-containing protein [Erythrobacter aureus]AXK41121.1 lytic transglycosylase domain-containing protein [Erythrobacter aureus]
MLVQRLLLTGLVSLALSSPTLVHAQASAPVRQTSRIDIAAHVREASLRFGLPELWIYAVIRVESAGQTRAVSSAGAMGLMQLMPGTWARQRARFSLGTDPFDPRDNIMAGTSYLREMCDRYGAQGFLAAYNAGPRRYEDWLAGRRSLPLETRRYVAKIAPLLQRERIFVAAAVRPSNTLQPTRRQKPGPAARTTERVEDDPPANPFARPEQPGHDLFAPVSTGDQP